VLERRPVADSDEPFLRELYASTRPEIAEWLPEQRVPFLDLQFWAQRQDWGARFPDSEHDVVVLDGDPVGRLWVAWPPGECRIVDLTLLPAHRRAGTGTAVAEDVLARADEAGLPVRLSVLRDNATGVAFWERLGFSVVAADEMYAELERPLRAALPPRGSRESSR
jgi:ribosomal protein S18 acetylase RimI-like enzyme